MLGRFRTLCVAFVATLLPLGAAAQDTTAPGTGNSSLAVELNKLEPSGQTCRAYFIVRNNTGADLTALDLDTFLFDTDGIILQRLALPFGAAPSARMRIVPFDFDLGCNAIGSLFINDILTCEGATDFACADVLATSSRAAASLDF